MCCWIQRHVTQQRSLYHYNRACGLGTFKHYAIMQFMRDLNMQFMWLWNVHYVEVCQ